MAKALSRTLNLFQLNKIDRDLFTWTGESVGLKRIFGGQIMAQCLIAGYQTVAKGRMAHSPQDGSMLCKTERPFLLALFLSKSERKG